MTRDSLVPVVLVDSSGVFERDLGHPFLSLHREMSRLFDDVFHRSASGPIRDGSQQRGPMTPSINVSETDTEVRISADLPAGSGSDINVSLVDDIFTAERRLEEIDEKADHHLLERSSGTFLRALRLPYSVDSDKIRAEFDDGVLRVTISKCKNTGLSRKIPVQSCRTEHRRRNNRKQAAQKGQQSGPK
jgi:HSP20 family protein